jgi:hypothetical protein
MLARADLVRVSLTGRIAGADFAAAFFAGALAFFLAAMCFLSRFVGGSKNQVMPPILYFFRETPIGILRKQTK